MSLTDTNNVVCDACGADVGNGGVGACVVISRLNQDTGMVENLHLCLGALDEEGKTTKKGCGDKILTPTRLANFTERQRRAARDSDNE